MYVTFIQQIVHLTISRFKTPASLEMSESYMPQEAQDRVDYPGDPHVARPSTIPDALKTCAISHLSLLTPSQKLPLESIYIDQDDGERIEEFIKLLSEHSYLGPSVKRVSLSVLENATLASSLLKILPNIRVLELFFPHAHGWLGADYILRMSVTDIFMSGKLTTLHINNLHVSTKSFLAIIPTSVTSISFSNVLIDGSPPGEYLPRPDARIQDLTIIKSPDITSLLGHCHNNPWLPLDLLHLDSFHFYPDDFDQEGDVWHILICCASSIRTLRWELGSTGKYNPYGHVNIGTLTRLKDLYITIEAEELPTLHHLLGTITKKSVLENIELKVICTAEEDSFVTEYGDRLEWKDLDDVVDSQSASLRRFSLEFVLGFYIEGVVEKFIESVKGSFLQLHDLDSAAVECRIFYTVLQ
ncbi:hypothetical protein BDQ12DRAFT_693912 [Crucibulum laeve]|uniref:Uncharacterized protein n=1 Tax=Crucibulum laeve TaxID=68775 RepID=A0A5C3LEN2_9AGAR|nr:hypothetical protein BDQ12DRAFT_693912 [Crucibulum laeve]